MTSSTADDAHASHFRMYAGVFISLCALTALSVLADLVHLADRRVLAVIVLAIASAKAACVMLYFMHLKFERAWKYLLLAPTLILAASLPLALASDIGLHYYTPDVPQDREYDRLHGSATPGETVPGDATGSH